MKFKPEKYKWSGTINTRIVEKAVKAKLTPIDGILGVTPIGICYEEFGDINEVIDLDDIGDYI